MEGGDLKPQCEVELEGSQTGQEGGAEGGRWLLKPVVGRIWQVRAPLRSPLGCPSPVPGFPPGVLPRGDRVGQRSFSPGETVLDQVAVPTLWPRSHGT